MKSTKWDWEYLGKDVFWPGLSFVAAALLLAVSYWYHAVQANIYEGHTNHHEAMSEDYDALVYRRRLMDRYQFRYRALQDTGFVARESRLDWIESIRSIANELELPNVTYSLDPQLEALQPVQSNLSGAEVQVFVSRLALELELVHEADLLRFFARLEHEAPGLMKVDQCSLERQFDVDQALLPETNISANCSLGMFSVVTSDVEPVVTQVSL